MPRKRPQMNQLFNVEKRSNVKCGEYGFDNQRENIDPHLKTKSIQGKEYHAKEIVFEKNTGDGIKIDVTNPDYGWHDIIGKLTSVNFGATKPNFTTYRDGIKQFEFAVGEEEFLDFHIPHDYKEGTDLYIHVHWSHTGTLVTGGSVTFDLEMSYCKGHNQSSFPASKTVQITGTASTTQYQHIVSEEQASISGGSATQFDTDEVEVDGVILVRVSLSANNITVSGGAVPDPFIHFVDIHYQSTNIPTKNKSPNFYT